MSDENAFEVTTKLQRGTSTDDRDTVKASVAANDLDELDDKLEAMRSKLADHAQKVRGIQPDDQTGESIDEDQGTLDEVEP